MLTLGLSNYYGVVCAYEEDGKYYMELDDYNGKDTIQISQRFFEEIEREFGI